MRCVFIDAGWRRCHDTQFSSMKQKFREENKGRNIFSLLFTFSISFQRIVTNATSFKLLIQMSCSNMFTSNQNAARFID